MGRSMGCNHHLLRFKSWFCHLQTVFRLRFFTSLSLFFFFSHRKKRPLTLTSCQPPGTMSNTVFAQLIDAEAVSPRIQKTTSQNVVLGTGQLTYSHCFFEFLLCARYSDRCFHVCYLIYNVQGLSHSSWFTMGQNEVQGTDHLLRNYLKTTYQG